MKFCNHCENMLYTKLVGVNEDELMYYCRNCNIVEPCDVYDLCVSKINFKRSEQKYQNSVSEYTKLDPTLPRTNAIKCPNLECPTNVGDEKREIVMIRYDDVQLKYVYLCASCDTTWKNFEQ